MDILKVKVNGQWIPIPAVIGPKGDTGDAFDIKKTYTSIASMEADFSGTDVQKGQFVIVDSSAESTDNGKIYKKGEQSWEYVAQVRGPKGETGATPSISVGTVTTLTPNQSAYVNLDSQSTDEHPIFNFGIPKGETGSAPNIYGNTVTMSSSDPTTVAAAINSKADDAVFEGATDEVDGADGLVPGPEAGDEEKFLKGDGTWSSVPDGLPEVTSSDNGKSLDVVNGEWAVGSKKIDKEYNTDPVWLIKQWSGSPAYLGGNNIWSEGDNIYYSSGSTHYVLDKSTSTWSTKTWNGLMNFNGAMIWSDGDNTYYSSGSTHYVLDKSTSTWSTKTWNGLTNFYGNNIWSDGDNTYYSSGSTHYVLDKSTSTWSTKTWNGLTNFNGAMIWSDGDNIYCSSGSTHYVLDKSTSTWSTKTWNGLTNFYGNNIWSDGDNIYCSSQSDNKQYVLDKGTSPKLLLGSNGEFNAIDAKNVLLPAVTSSDNGKILRVVDGEWAAAGVDSSSFGAYRVDAVINVSDWVLTNGVYRANITNTTLADIVTSSMDGSETWLEDESVMLGETTFTTYNGGIYVDTTIQPTATWNLHILLAMTGAVVPTTAPFANGVNF